MGIKKMKYQLVIQFPAESEDDFNHLIEIEGELEERLPRTSEVDGHDFGSGEMNIFILTNEPVEIFEKTKIILTEKGTDLATMKAAYRDIESDSFIILWPDNLKEFIVT